MSTWTDDKPKVWTLNTGIRINIDTDVRYFLGTEYANNAAVAAWQTVIGMSTSNPFKFVSYESSAEGTAGIPFDDGGTSRPPSTSLNDNLIFWNRATIAIADFNTTFGTSNGEVMRVSSATSASYAAWGGSSWSGALTSVEKDHFYFISSTVVKKITSLEDVDLEILTNWTND